MNRPKLLLADDSVTIQKVVSLTFTDEGIDVITVGDGDAALEMATSDRPDIVMADVHMPGLNGYELCEQLRRQPSTKELPVLLLVGSFEPFDDARSVEVGADGHITKPFQSIRQLVAQVSELIERSRSQAHPAAELPEEPKSSVQGSDPVRDTMDIESLYQESLKGPEERENDTAKGAVPGTFIDVGMDDQMIETSSPEQESSSVARFAPGDAAYTSDNSDAELEKSLYDPFAATERIEFGPSGQVTQSGGEEDDQTADRTPTFARHSISEETDLLEIPLETGDSGVGSEMPNGSSKEDRRAQVVSLSPELIDAIVDKVIQRLAERSNNN